MSEEKNKSADAVAERKLLLAKKGRAPEESQGGEGRVRIRVGVRQGERAVARQG